MLAYRRADVRDLNDAARTLLAQRRPARPRRARGRRARVPRRRPRPLPPQRRAARRPQRHPRDRRRPRPQRGADAARRTRGALRTLDGRYAAEHLDARLRAHRPRRPGRHRRARLRPPPRPGRAPRVGLRRLHPRPNETRLYATGESLEGEQHGSLLTPRDPTARLANALERAGAEKLASVQTLPETSEVTRRARERCRRQREQALETAEQRLSAAQEQLRRLGRLGHRRQRAELRAEISHQRTALRLARRQLTESPVEQPELRPKRAARTRLQPEPSMPTRTRDRGRHLDLEL